MHRGGRFGFVLLASVCISTRALAVGFALEQQSVSNMGYAFAGGAASAEDASTIFWNPAGLPACGRNCGDHERGGGQLYRPQALCAPLLKNEAQGRLPALRSSTIALAHGNGPPLGAFELGKDQLEDAILHRGARLRVVDLRRKL